MSLLLLLSGGSAPPPTGLSVEVCINWYDAAGVLISSSPFGTPAATDAAFDARPTVTATAPGGATYATLTTKVLSMTTGDVVSVDSVQFENNLAATTYEHARSIAVLLTALRVNRVPNPSFEVNTAGWGVDFNCSIARSTAHSIYGVAAAALTSLANGDMAMMTVPGTTIPLLGSTGYALSGHVMPQSTQRSVQMRIDWYTGGGVFISSSLGDPVVEAAVGTWVRPTVVAVSPPLAGYAAVGVVVTGAAAGGEVHYLDSVLFERSSLLQPYFDGSFLPSEDYIWEAGAHSSPTHYYPRRIAKTNRLAALLPSYLPQERTATLLLAQPSA